MTTARENSAFTLWRYAVTYTAYGVFGIGALTLIGICFPVLRLTQRDTKIRQRRSRRLVCQAFRLFIAFLRLTRVVKLDLSDLGKTPLPSNESILVANHPTLLDYVFIASQYPEIDCVVRASLLNNPFLRGIILSCGYLTNDDPETIFTECKKRFQKGDTLLIFPEGTRSVPGKALRLHRGAAQLAVRCNVPIEVLRIECSEYWLGKQIPWYQIPARRPVVRLSHLGSVVPSDYARQDDNSPALLSRRITEHIHILLASENNKEKTHDLS